MIKCLHVGLFQDMKEHLAKPHAVPPVTEDAQCRQVSDMGTMWMALGPCWWHGDHLHGT